jgi:hypothetical protein
VQNRVETKGTGARKSETMLQESEGGEQKTGNRSVSAESHENHAGGLTRTINVYR